MDFKENKIMAEIWKQIKGFEGCYEISNLGSVKSVERKIKHKNRFIRLREKILKLDNRNGYYFIKLQYESIKQKFYVHRLVANHFISNPLNKPCINHINGIKKDNNVNNLEWVTYSENSFDAYRKGLKFKKMTLPIIQEVKEKYKTGNFTQRELAAIYSVAQSQIGKAIRI